MYNSNLVWLDYLTGKGKSNEHEKPFVSTFEHNNSAVAKHSASRLPGGWRYLWSGVLHRDLRGGDRSSSGHRDHFQSGQE